MPDFANKEPVGDFVITVEPVGWFRRLRLVKKWLPYFAGRRPRLNLTINNSNSVANEVLFNACLYRARPDAIEPDMWALPLMNKQTPFEDEIRGDMLTSTDGYNFEVVIDPITPNIKGESLKVAFLPVKVKEFIVWGFIQGLVFAFIGGIFIIFGAALTLIIQYITKSVIQP